MLLFIGGSEIVVILLIVVMLFGADKIPEIARGLGKGLQEIKNASNEIKREINSQSGGVVGMAQDIKEATDQGRRKMTDLKGTIQSEVKKTFDQKESEQELQNQHQSEQQQQGENDNDGSSRLRSMNDTENNENDIPGPIARGSVSTENKEA